MPVDRTPWPHAPTHQLTAQGAFFITAATFHQAHHFRGAERLGVLQCGLLTVAGEAGWRLEAWSVFSNHYHFVGHSPPETTPAETLHLILQSLHAKTATWLNRRDRTPGRKVWHNYWDTRLTHQISYLARLNYVHQNPVKHGLVAVANQYPWCSAAWFERTASPAKVRALYALKYDKIQTLYDFENDPEYTWKSPAK